MKKSSLQLAFTIILFVVVLGGYALWYHALGMVSDQVASLTSEVAAKNHDAADAKVAEQQLAKLSAEESSIHGYFVAPSDIVPFLESIQVMGTTTGAKVSVVSVSANAAPRPHLDLSLKITGSFDAVMRTVGAIEYSPHDIRVTSLALDATPSDKEKIWTASLAAKIGTAASSTPATP